MSFSLTPQEDHGRRVPVHGPPADSLTLSQGAADGASERVTLYFAEDGARLWVDRARSGPAHAFSATWPEASLVRDPAKDFVATGPKGCQGR